jgi:hypothetical protein
MDTMIWIGVIGLVVAVLSCISTLVSPLLGARYQFYLNEKKSKEQSASGTQPPGNKLPVWLCLVFTWGIIPCGVIAFSIYNLLTIMHDPGPITKMTVLAIAINVACVAVQVLSMFLSVFVFLMGRLHEFTKVNFITLYEMVGTLSSRILSASSEAVVTARLQEHEERIEAIAAAKSSPRISRKKTNGNGTEG